MDATCLSSPAFLVFSYSYLPVVKPTHATTWLEQLLNCQLGGMGSPYSLLYIVSYQP